MTVRPAVALECNKDGCTNFIVMRAASPDEARQSAARVGWISVLQRTQGRPVHDFCPWHEREGKDGSYHHAAQAARDTGQDRGPQEGARDDASQKGGG